MADQGASEERAAGGAAEQGRVARHRARRPTPPRRRSGKCEPRSCYRVVTTWLPSKRQNRVLSCPVASEPPDRFEPETARFSRCFWARPGRFELPTPGSVGSDGGSAAVSSDRQVVGIIQDRDRAGVQQSQPLAGFRSPLVTTLLQATRPQRGDETRKSCPTSSVLTVREAAEILKVSTATVYALVQRGELPHVRVSNAIRIVLTVPRGAGNA
jgi:excisionase family DNA binding protein